MFRIPVRYFSGSAASPRVLVTGATGQIGMELVPYMRSRYGKNHVIATDIKVADEALMKGGPFQYLDVTDATALNKIVVDNNINTVVHLASLLSAVGEKNPSLAMLVNARGSENVLAAAATHKLKVFSPSTIAVFGPSTPRDNTPDPTVMRPTTIYGVTKVYMELLGEYYAAKFGVDFRSVRYPGIISNMALPGGGTTDYAVEIYYEALKAKKYQCFLSAGTALPMLYMPDCLRGTVEMIEAPREKLKQRVYNLTGFSFTPDDVSKSIAKYVKGFEVTYKPDFRQAIADTWPRSIDDSKARQDWGWHHEFDLDAMTKDMLKSLSKKLDGPGKQALQL
jgi:threonine 3-dehydrogenase